jgi:hypothetical protein
MSYDPSRTQPGQQGIEMAENESRWRRPRAWMTLISIIILLIFLYFYRPFESYLIEHIPQIHFYNVVFWFASLVGIIAYVISHWESYRNEIFRSGGELNVENLVFDTLQIAILVAVIFFAGATLQAVEMLSEHLINRGPIIDPGFGRRLLSIVVLVILAILFYLLHHLVRAFRSGWAPRRPHPRGPSGEN